MEKKKRTHLNAKKDTKKGERNRIKLTRK